MKSIFIFIILLLAIYGGYELYKKYEKFQTCDFVGIKDVIINK